MLHVACFIVDVHKRPVGSYVQVSVTIIVDLLQTRVDTLCLNLQALCQSFFDTNTAPST
ncbi:hypothetical protein VCLMA_A2207 [Vibrio cholerae LMA3984-4]|nr:hypothetical protein VCLMA_A2207 [Vibrio cholerae LMA3984-4]CSI54340.1 Uncharacterised protein [Vibrio cholerae]